MAIFVSMVQIEVAFNNKKAVWWAQNLRKGLGEFSRQYYPHSGGTKKKKKSLLHYRDSFSKDSKPPHVVSVPWTCREISGSNTFFQIPY